MTLILFALLIGMALGAVLKGMLKITLVVTLALATVVFTCRELHIDWRSLASVAADQAVEQYHHVQPAARRHVRGWL